ncbi:hypothetical protein RRG08_004004 [Elysia crispata]|uniref:Uncharacterized protein n=1 Tax=Elysia crispata TaxID=231223 RepID=A0AAE0Y5L7_9GAST|nr:hypothetical protein RRG08_004004 [Elysia crispata]
MESGSGFNVTTTGVERCEDRSRTPKITRHKFTLDPISVDQDSKVWPHVAQLGAKGRQSVATCGPTRREKKTTCGHVWPNSARKEAKRLPEVDLTGRETITINVASRRFNTLDKKALPESPDQSAWGNIDSAEVTSASGGATGSCLTRSRHTVQIRLEKTFPRISHQLDDFLAPVR